MDSEFENKPQDQSSENERTREGYNPAGGYQKSYRPVGRTQRPRINSHRAYSSDRSSSNSEGGFRPEGFGAGLQSTGSSERPQRSSYQSRGGYGNSVSREAISLVLSRVAIVLVTTIMMSRVVISLVSRVATSHVSRAATSLVLSRVVMATTVVVMVVPRVVMATTVVVMVVLSRVVMATTVAVMAVPRVVAMATTVVAVSVSTLLVTIQMLSIA